MEGWDPNTKSTLTQIPLLSTRAGPRDGAAWTQRLKEEYRALIAYTGMNKSNDNDWFRISATNPEGTHWSGKCWYVHNLRRYEFDLQFDIPVTYPATSPEIELPQLDGKTHKVREISSSCRNLGWFDWFLFSSICLFVSQGSVDIVMVWSVLFRCIEVISINIQSNPNLEQHHSF